VKRELNKAQGSKGEFDGGEVVAVLGLDHSVRVGPVESGETVGGIGDRVGGGPGEFAGGLGGGKGVVEFGLGGGTAGKTLGKASPLLEEFGGAVVGPVGVIAEGDGVGRLQRFDNAYEMGGRRGGAARTRAGPLFGFHQIGKKANVEIGGSVRVVGTNGAVGTLEGGGIDVSVWEKTFGGGEAGEVEGLWRHGERPPEPVRVRLRKG